MKVRPILILENQQVDCQTDCRSISNPKQESRETETPKKAVKLLICKHLHDTGIWNRVELEDVAIERGNAYMGSQS